MAARTIDSIADELGLAQIHFLKMNIEGAERLAIQGMVETLPQTQTLCICCHDFLAELCGDDLLRTRKVVIEFLLRNGLRIGEEGRPGVLPYVREQVWAYNEPRPGLACDSRSLEIQEINNAGAEEGTRT